MSPTLDHPTASVLLIDANKTDRAFYADGLKRCSPGGLILEAGDGQTGRQIYGCVRVLLEWKLCELNQSWLPRVPVPNMT